MMRRKNDKEKTLLFLILGFFVMKGQGFLWSIPLEWTVSGALLAILEDNGLASDPMPLCPMPGVRISTPLTPWVEGVVSCDIYGTYYGYSDSLQRPIPVAIENRSALVVGALVGIGPQFRIPIASPPFALPGPWTLSFFVGPVVEVRASFLASGLEGADAADAQEEINRMSSYFWSSGRWLSFSLGGSLFFLPLGSYQLGLSLTSWLPLYRIWTDYNQPFVEGWKVAFGFLIRKNP
ncbi:hypothetical protein [Treponema sp. J25]|jgi:hypothetical protein|uniref:hypothetical protein n=1 Tax=Treponema sp. J25 TaxID=2094121 RepID=UPI001042B0F5|nr:hypothetical protein [Treponema sp. J25]TCW62345.1 hypothetical protein C5O22_01080 [Treponema sp. J25]